MNEDSVKALKARLRTEARHRRSAIPAGRMAADSAALAGLDLACLGLLDGTEVAAYAALPGELDPAPLADRLQASGACLSLPRITDDRRSITFRRWHPGDPVSTGVWGIREPLATAKPVTPAIVLLPLLSFDRLGYRLGYGGGYYDRALAGLRATGPVLAVGLAFSEQEIDAVPHLDYDQRLDWVLCPQGARKLAD